jgi:hypothetical protein
MSSNVTEFDSNWSYNGKPITYFIEIELCALFTSPYDDYVKREFRLFSLRNEKFTPQNLREKIEKYSVEVVKQRVHTAHFYFRLYTKAMIGLAGTVEINTSEICSLFGPDYFNTLVEKHK